MRKIPLQIHPSSLGGFALEGPYTRTAAQRARRAIGAWIAALLVLIAGGCGPDASNSGVLERIGGGRQSNYTDFIRDRETGCWYLSTGQAMFIRLNADGKPMCGRA